MTATRVLGLIPAKAGSMRFPKKNIAVLCGKSLLERAAAALKDSCVVDDIVVSTESGEVQAVAEQVGLEVPFARPPELARDPAGVVDVFRHALSELSAQGREYRAAVICLPTCPLRSPEDIRAAWDLHVEGGRTVMSVNTFPHTPFAALKRSDSGLMEPWFPEFWGRKSQEMPPAYRPNGAVHVVSTAEFQRTGSMLGPPVLGYEMPQERSVDVDTEADLAEAEALLSVSARARGQ